VRGLPGQPGITGLWRRIPRAYLLLLGFILLLALIALGVRLAAAGLTAGQDGSSSARSLTPRNVDIQPGGAGHPEYNQMLEELNRAGAEMALISGESFVAAPVVTGGKRGDRTGKTEPAARNAAPGIKAAMTPQPLAKPPDRPAAAPGTGPGPAGREPGDDGALTALLNDLRAAGQTQPELGAFAVEAVSGDRGPAADRGTEAAGSGVRDLYPGLTPGNILYAVTEVAVNSDSPAPVLARVVGGPLRGAGFIGSFQLHGENLTMSFGRFIAPDGGLPAAGGSPRPGQILEVEALAVDPSNNSPALSGQVSRRFLQRWGGLLASSFLDGFGQALSGRGASVTLYGDVVVSGGNRDASMAEVSLEALGQVGRGAASQLERNFGRPPTVIIPAGSPVGILIIGLKS
jgi:hypothetical protein